MAVGNTPMCEQVPGSDHTFILPFYKLISLASELEEAQMVNPRKLYAFTQVFLESKLTPRANEEALNCG